MKDISWWKKVEEWNNDRNVWWKTLKVWTKKWTGGTRNWSVPSGMFLSNSTEKFCSYMLHSTDSDWFSLPSYSHDTWYWIGRAGSGGTMKSWSQFLHTRYRQQVQIPTEQKLSYWEPNILELHYLMSLLFLMISLLNSTVRKLGVYFKLSHQAHFKDWCFSPV